MKKILIGLLLALLVASGLNAFITSPATSAAPQVKAGYVKVNAKQLKAWGTSVKHADDDSGYTGAIHVVCENGNHRWLGVGDATFLQSSNPGCSLSGVNRIIVDYNQTVYCKNYAPPYENTYFYTGTNYVPSNRTYKCYSQRPL